MGCFNRKCLSFLVGWLNILLCFLVPVSYLFIHVIPINYTGIEKQVLLKLQMILIDELLLYVSCGFLLWLVPTILLLKGIRQNRRKLMVPWIHITTILVIIVMYYALPHYGFYGVYHCVFLGVFEIFLILCLIPVTMLYKQMDIPPLVLATQCNLQVKVPEDDKRYMPIFENY